MKNQLTTLDQVRLAGLEALARELGPVGMIRFLQQYEFGKGNYSADEPPGSRQLPAKNVVDLRFEKEFPIFEGQFRTTIDVFNLFNSATQVGGLGFGIVRSITNPDFGRFRAFIPRAL